MVEPANKVKTTYIPVLKPSITEAEIQAVAEVMRSGWLGLGPKTEEFETAFANLVGAKCCVGLNSCTAALHLVMAALNLHSGDEVIVSPLTFISTVHAIVYCGAKPVFADVLPDTLTIDPDDVREKITPHTRGIIGIDMAGHPCELDELLAIADEHGLVFVEDAAHACGAFYKDKPIGSIAPFTCFSFHAVKNLTCGEGGAITCNHQWYQRWFKKMRWLGISKDTWERTVGEESYKWKYWVEEFGFKYHMNDIAAAIGLVQLKRLDQLNTARRKIVNEYNQAFSNTNWLITPQERSYAKSSWHLYQVRLPNEVTRDRFINYLSRNGIAPGVHYIPAYYHPSYRGYKAVCPTVSKLWKVIVTLPIFPDLTTADQQKVIKTVREFVP